MKKFLALFLALAMLLTLVACGGTTTDASSEVESEAEVESKTEAESEAEESEAEETAEGGRFDSLQTTDEEVNLYLYWHNLTPTVNEEPTEESPTVKNACRNITAAWVEEHPNATVEFCRNMERTDEWMTVNYTAHTGPDTIFYWGGSQWVEKGMALVLDEIMESPNYYEPGSPVWKDMFPSYLFDGSEGTTQALNERMEIIAVPQVLDPGSATAYYYNADLAAELGLSDVVATTSWKQLKDNILVAEEAGYTGDVLYYGGYGMWTGGYWDAQFSLNAAYFAPFKVDIDLDGDDQVSSAELVYAQWTEGYFYLKNNPAMVEYWEEYFWKVKEALEEGCMEIDYTQPWADGTVLYVEEGLWSIVDYASNPELTFEVGCFPPPYQQPEDSEYVCEIGFHDGPYNPSISVAINIMDPELQERPDYILDYVVDWMKFALTNENLSMQVEEDQTALGATKGCSIPASMVEWVKQEFPMAPSGNALRPGTTDLTSTDRNALYEEYGTGMIDQAEFIERYDELLYKDMQNYFLQEGYEDIATEWAADNAELDISVFDNDPVAP